MNKVRPETIKALLESNDDITISLYLPTHRSPTSVHVGEDKIRFKNLIRAGKEALEAKGVDQDSIRKIANYLENDFYNNDSFWQYTTEGLAVFCSLSGARYFNLPIECEEYVSAGGAYDVTPLLAILSYDQPYYILALAMHEPALYRGDIYGVERVDVEFPQSPEEALNIDEMFSNSRTVRAGGGYGPGNPGSGAHGQGDSRQAGQEEKAEFFRIIDDTVLSSEEVKDNLPILIAGSEGEIADFRSISRNKRLTESHLAGNYTESSGIKPQELHTRSWHLIEQEYCDAKKAAEVERFNELHGTGRSSADPEDIATAAKEGRVEALLLGMLTVTRDTVSDGSDAVTKLVFHKSYHTNGMDVNGRLVHSQGGEVVAVLLEDMPEGAQQAAIYRY